MIEKNYYSCKYNNSQQDFRTDVNDKWNIKFEIGNIERRPPRAFYDEVLHSCELIYEEFRKYTPVLNLYFSGGMDSECMLRCFNTLGIPVNPIVITHYYTPLANETLNAFRVCNELSLTPIVFDLNFHKIIKSDILQTIGIKYQTARLGMLELLYIMEKIQEPSILADDIQLVHWATDENLLNKDESSYLEWLYEIREDEDGVFYRYEALTGIPTISDFYRYTPQSWAAMILADEIKDIVFNNRFKASATSTKNQMMAREFNVPWREKTGVFAAEHHWKIRNKVMSEIEEHIFPFTTIRIRYNDLLLRLGYEL